MIFCRKHRAKILELEVAVTELRKSLKGLEEADRVIKQNLTEENATLRSQLDVALAENKSIRREQTEADLFFISVKIMQNLIQGKSGNDIIDVIKQQRLLQLQLWQQQPGSIRQSQNNSLAPLFGGLGPVGGLGK